jgi:ESF2/ABP1 family protein
MDARKDNEYNEVLTVNTDTHHNIVTNTINPEGKKCGKMKSIARSQPKVGGNPPLRSSQEDQEHDDDDNDEEEELQHDRSDESDEDEEYGSNDGDKNSDDNEDQDNDGDDIPVAKRPKKVHKLSLTETEDFNEKLKKRGVVYIARIPPKMTPTKVKALLSEFGEVTRVYLVEEDSSVRKRRKKELGGSGGKRYVEGWVEFASKRKAKHVALSLNNTPISNHKRNPHYGE